MQIRNAKLSDSDDILNWRNDDSSRIMFVDSELVSKPSHLKWFTKALNKNSCYLFIGEKNKIKIGVVRFDCDIKNFISIVSINLNPKMRGLGLATNLLDLSIKRVPDFQQFLFQAAIKEENIISKKIFKKCGFKIKYSHEGLDYFILK